MDMASSRVKVIFINTKGFTMGFTVLGAQPDKFIVLLCRIFWGAFSQCRERGTTYKAKLQVTVQWKLDNQLQGNVTKVIGNIPIMVKVRFKQLYGMIFCLILLRVTVKFHFSGQEFCRPLDQRVVQYCRLKPLS